MFSDASELLFSAFCQALGTERVFCFFSSGKKGPWVAQAQTNVGKGMLEGLPVSSAQSHARPPALTASPGWWTCSWALCWALAGFVRWTFWHQPQLPHLVCTIRFLLLKVRSSDQPSITCLEMANLRPHLRLPKAVCILRRSWVFLAHLSLRSALLEDFACRGDHWGDG